MMMNKKTKKYESESTSTDQIKAFLVSINGVEDSNMLNNFVDSMPAKDARHIRSMYKKVNPDIKITNMFECSSCDFEQEMEVPFNTEFFWPDR